MGIFGAFRAYCEVGSSLFGRESRHFADFGENRLRLALGLVFVV
jgi:hypothetical protein